MAGKTRRKRSNIDGQEEMVAALWDFAAAVETAVKDGTATWLKDASGAYRADNEETRPIGVAMQRIADGFGYRLLEIQ